jgi:hypothetical protein
LSATLLLISSPPKKHLLGKILPVRVNIGAAMLGTFALPLLLSDSSLETPYHLLERSHLASKNDRNPPDLITTYVS